MTFEAIVTEYSTAVDVLNKARHTRYAVATQTDDLTKSIAELNRSTLAEIETEWQDEGRKSNEGQRLAARDGFLADDEVYQALVGNLRGSQKQLSDLDIEIEGLLLNLSLLKRMLDMVIATHGDVQDAYANERTAAR